VVLSVYPPVMSRQRLGKDFPTSTKDCWTFRFLFGPCSVKGKNGVSSSQGFLFLYFRHSVEALTNVVWNCQLAWEVFDGGDKNESFNIVLLREYCYQ
jgi:hypothetical protein